MSHKLFHNLLVTLSFSLSMCMSVQAFQVKLPNTVPLMDGTGTSITLLGSPPLSTFSVGEKPEYCLTDALETPGQAWRVNVSAGGVSLEANQKNTLTPQTRGKSQALGLDTVIDSQHTVNVLVIDKFSKTTFPLQGPDGSTLEISLSHGKLVEAHLREVLSSTSNKINIKELDIDALPKSFENTQSTTSDLVNYLYNRVMKEISSRDPLIINMSIAILPCQLQKHYFLLEKRAKEMRPPKRLPFKLFLLALAEKNGRSGDANTYIRSIISPAISNDPLEKWIKQQQAKWNGAHQPFVPVASSGNYALPFQTMPAAWPTVLGVASTTLTTSGSFMLSPWSDVGDVREVGQWYTLGTALPKSLFDTIVSAKRLDSPTSSVSINQTNFAYLGTSFAAPTVTASLAIVMGRQTSGCFQASTGEFTFYPYVIKGTKAKNLNFAHEFLQCK